MSETKRPPEWDDLVYRMQQRPPYVPNLERDWRIFEGNARPGEVATKLDQQDRQIIELRSEMEHMRQRTATGVPKGAQLYVILPDQQLPWLDHDLHEVVLRFLDTVRPYGVIFSGDLFDLPEFSLKYPWNQNMVPDPQTSARRSQQFARHYVAEIAAVARPQEYVLVPGNHEERYLKYVAQRAPLLHALDGAGDQPLISLASYLDADRVGLRIATDPSGMAVYPAAHHVIGKHLAVYHGWIVRRGAGASAHGHLEHLQHSVMVGHTHRQAKVLKTRHNLDRSISTLVGVESGTLATVRGGLGHTVAPDWQQGFATALVYDDGTFDADLATYTNGVLRWNHQRWERSASGIIYKG